MNKEKQLGTITRLVDSKSKVWNLLYQLSRESCCQQLLDVFLTIIFFSKPQSNQLIPPCINAQEIFYP